MKNPNMLSIITLAAVFAVLQSSVMIGQNLEKTLETQIEISNGAIEE